MIKVIYVDDEESLLEIGKEFLERPNEINVDTACSAKMALKMLKEEHYDVIVSDYQMPQMNGIQLLTSLRGSGNQIPFILFTGKGREEVVIEALNSGANFYLQKGGNPVAVFRELEHHITLAVKQFRAEEAIREKNKELESLTEQMAAAQAELQDRYDTVTKAQEELRSEVTFSDSLMNSLPGIFYLYDAETLRLIRWNKNYEVLSGFTPEELFGKYIMDRISSEKKQEFAAFVKKTLLKGHGMVEAPWLKKDGSTTTFLLTGNRFDTKDGSFLMGVGIDISERKHIEEELRKNKARYDQLAEQSGTVTWEIDPNGLYTYVSEFCEKVYGYRPEELVGKKHYFDIVPEYDRPAILNDVVMSMREKKSFVGFINPVQRKDGTVIMVSTNAIPLVDTDGSLKGYQGTDMDITEALRDKEALQQKTALFDAQMAATIDGVLIIDPNMKRIFVNNRIVELFDVPESVMKNENDRALLDHVQNKAKDPAGFRQKVNFLYENKNEVSRDIIEFKNGMVLDRYSSPVIGNDGKYYGRAWTFRDVTEQKRSSDTLYAANRKLNLLSGITRHDINNQLTVLTGNLAMIKMNHPELIGGRHLTGVENAVEQISAMIQFTKIYEDIGVNEPTWQDIHDLVDIASLHVHLTNVTLVNDIRPGIKVFADPLIKNVFLNLIDNAVRHGGETKNIRFYLESVDGVDLLICEDDGSGIAREIKDNLFKQGYGKSHGFGLFLSREILSITNIMIVEEGTPGRGARFVLTIPPGGIKH